MDIFIISPYTDDDFDVRNRRAMEADTYVSELTQQGKVCYSAISAMHHLLYIGELPGTWDYWRMHCEVMIMHAYEVHVLCLDGWEQSEGVKAEMEIANVLGKKIKYITKTGRNK